MKTLMDAEPFRIVDVLGRPQDLFDEVEAAPVEPALLVRLEAAPPGTVIPVDFGQQRVASAAARRILSRALRRIMSGELADRYLVLTRLGTAWYNVQVMLKDEGLTVVERPVDGSPPRLMGRVDPAIEATYVFLARERTATAGDIADAFVQTQAAAGNRLTRLVELGLARRIDREVVAGGGRKYVYAAVI